MLKSHCLLAFLVCVGCTKATPEAQPDRSSPVAADEATPSTGHGLQTPANDQTMSDSESNRDSQPPTGSHMSSTQPASLTLNVVILDANTELRLPYAKDGAYVNALRGRTPFDDALRVQAPALLSSKDSVADRLRAIDKLRADTHAAFVSSGGSGRDPAVGHFDAALEDLVMAYFSRTKDAILGARLPDDEKRARLAELAIDQVAVLAWAPALKASIGFYAIEGKLSLDNQ